MTPEQLAALYLSEVTDSPTAFLDWRASELWTPRATRALRSAGLNYSPKSEAAARGFPDKYGQSEYLNLDVCLWDPTCPWGPPLFIAEHESKKSVVEVKYSTWKLLVVQATYRVMVTYFGEESPFPTFTALLSAVREVCCANPDRAIILIASDTRPAHTNTEVLGQHMPPIVISG